MSFDPEKTRAAYPALRDGFAYLDGAAGTQVPESVIDAISSAYEAGIGNTGGVFPASLRSGTIETECRHAVADLVGGEPGGVVLGPNMTTLTYRFAETLSRGWSPGDEVVVSRLDHDANIRPWVQAAERAGAAVRWAEIDPRDGTLDAEQYHRLVSERTRLVAVTAASNLIGTRPDVATITSIAHAAGALAYVDGVHWTPHGPVDVGALGADLYATSAYKWSGPHIGAVVADRALLERLHPDKLVPSPEYVPDRFERGTPSFADYAGVIAAVDHLASLAADDSPGRRGRLLASMTEVESFEGTLFERLRSGLESMSHVVSYGKAPRRAPTAYFNVGQLSPEEVARALGRREVNVWHGDNYAWELVGALDLRERGGAVRAGIVHYNDESDVDRLLEAVASLA